MEVHKFSEPQVVSILHNGQIVTRMKLFIYRLVSFKDDTISTKNFAIDVDYATSGMIEEANIIYYEECGKDIFSLCFLIPSVLQLQVLEDLSDGLLY